MADPFTGTGVLASSQCNFHTFQKTKEIYDLDLFTFYTGNIDNVK